MQSRVVTSAMKLDGVPTVRQHMSMVRLNRQLTDMTVMSSSLSQELGSPGVQEVQLTKEDKDCFDPNHSFVFKACFVGNIKVDDVVNKGTVRVCCWRVSGVEHTWIDGVGDCTCEGILAVDQRERHHWIWSRIVWCL